jgi:hypothetical protein
VVAIGDTALHQGAERHLADVSQPLAPARNEKIDSIEVRVAVVAVKTAGGQFSNAAADTELVHDDVGVTSGLGHPMTFPRNWLHIVSAAASVIRVPSGRGSERPSATPASRFRGVSSFAERYPQAYVPMSINVCFENPASPG